jgi:hypothetical protein
MNIQDLSKYIQNKIIFFFLFCNLRSAQTKELFLGVYEDIYITET